MHRSGLRHHLPLIRTFALMAVLLTMIGWALTSLGQNAKQDGLNPADWRWAPASSFADAAPPSEGWLPVIAEPRFETWTGPYWLRVPLPSPTPRDPHLWMFNAVAVRVYDGNRLLYAYDPAASRERLNLLTHWNLAPLPAPLPKEVRLLIDNRGATRPMPWISTVSQGELYVQLIRQDGFGFVLGALFLFTAVIATGLYGFRRDKLHLYFGLLAFCGFYASTVRNYLFQVYWDEPWFGYLEISVFPFGVYAFVSIVSEVFPSRRTAALRRLRKIVLGFAAASAVCAVTLEPAAYGWLVSYPLLALFLAAAGYVFHTLRRLYAEERGTDAVWMLSGFVIVVFFSLIHVLRTYMPVFFGRLQEKFPGLGDVPFDPLSIGLFLFFVCLMRVILYRFGAMNRKLQHIGEYLEDSVATRTAELHERTMQLQESRARLAETTLETAETIAASLMLEERQRITGNIHDTVGHALTATIVQLEAARRLLDRDPRLAMDKLAASQSLIRRGLEDIRQSVNLLNEDFSQYDLGDALRRLISETAQSTEAKFDVYMETLPDTLTALQKRMLFQALQEGITNGLRHGGSSRFRFSLTVKDPVIIFRLESDGRTYTPASYGFGLRAMSERVAQLGGVMSVEPGHPGCVLLLSLPYDAAGPRQARPQERLP